MYSCFFFFKKYVFIRRLEKKKHKKFHWKQRRESGPYSRYAHRGARYIIIIQCSSVWVYKLLFFFLISSRYIKSNIQHYRYYYYYTFINRVSLYLDSDLFCYSSTPISLSLSSLRTLHKASAKYCYFSHPPPTPTHTHIQHQQYR